LTDPLRRPNLDERIGLNSTADSETVSVRGKGAIEKPSFAVKVSGLSALVRRITALLGVNLIEPLRAQDSIKAWSVLQKD
jgi:hypothetical protein